MKVTIEVGGQKFENEIAPGLEYALTQEYIDRKKSREDYADKTPVDLIKEVFTGAMQPFVQRWPSPEIQAANDALDKAKANQAAVIARETGAAGD